MAAMPIDMMRGTKSAEEEEANIYSNLNVTREKVLTCSACVRDFFVDAMCWIAYVCVRVCVTETCHQRQIFERQESEQT